MHVEAFIIGVEEALLTDLREWIGSTRWPDERLSRFHAELDGIRVHFVHERARSGRGTPLILT